MLDIGRREFMTLLGGAAAAWPLAARAQQRERMRRIGVLMPGMADDPEDQARIAAFLQGCSELGWIVGRTCASTTAGAPAMPSAITRYAAELVALVPGRHLGSALLDLARCNRRPARVPIVFASRHRSGRRRLRRKLGTAGRQRDRLHDLRIRPGAKWLELLKEIAPRVTRVAVLRDPAVTSRIGQFAVHPVGGAVARDGIEPDRCTRCGRDRARHHASRASRMAA